MSCAPLAAEGGGLFEGCFPKSLFRAGLSVAVLWGFVSVASPGEVGAVSWVRECIKDTFCFDRPVSLSRQPGLAIDSLASRYRNGELILTIDMGLYAVSPEHIEKAELQSVLVDGRPAQLWLGETEAILVVPAIPAVASRGAGLSMSFQFAGKVSRGLVLRTIRSIDFQAAR